jgi:hypothetical protein
LGYANDLSQWLTYEPTDPQHNLAASWHVYGGNTCQTTSCFDRTVAPVAAQVPLVAGEVGESYDDSVCGTSETQTIVNWLDAHQASYLAWVWDTWGTSCADLSLITDYSGTPKSPNGTYFQSHFAALASATPPPTATTGPASTPTRTPTTGPTSTPTVTPVPSSTPVGTVTIDDSVTGTGPNQWSYGGTGWSACTSCNETNPPVTYYNASQHWTSTTGDRASLSFSGTRVALYGAVAPWHGIAAVSVDGGTATSVDLYAASKAGNVLLWTSPLLAAGAHTLTVQATGTKNGASTGTTIVVDRADIATSSAPVSNQTSIASGWNLVDLPSSGSGIRTAADLVTSLNGSLGAGAISLIATYANGRYSTYLPGYSTPQALSSTQGIYVLSTTSGTWAPPGSAYTSGQAIALLAGWNLVAAPFPAAGLVTTAIATEAAGCSVQTIVVYQNGSYQSWTPVATPFTVPSTAGMWLQCANSSTWTLS